MTLAKWLYIVSRSLGDVKSATGAAHGVWSSSPMGVVMDRRDAHTFARLQSATNLVAGLADVAEWNERHEGLDQAAFLYIHEMLWQQWTRLQKALAVSDDEIVQALKEHPLFDVGDLHAKIATQERIVRAIADDPEPFIQADGGYSAGCKYCEGGNRNWGDWPAGYIQIGVGMNRGWHAPDCAWVQARRPSRY